MVTAMTSGEKAALGNVSQPLCTEQPQLLKRLSVRPVRAGLAPTMWASSKHPKLSVAVNVPSGDRSGTGVSAPVPE